MEKLNQIKFLQGFEECCGYDGIAKSEIYIVTKQGKKYFVKFVEKNINSSLKKLFKEANIPSVKIVCSGKLGNQYYVVEEFADYKTLINYFDMLSGKDIYELGFRVSQNCFNLRQVYQDKPISQEDYLKSTTQILQSVVDFNNLNNFEKLTCDGQNFMFELRDYILKNIDLLKQSSLVFCLPNVHPDNFLFEKPGSILAADIENTDYHEFTSTIKNSLCSENENHIDKSLIFTQGYLEGLFQFDIPENILKCCNYMFVYSAFCNLIKFLKQKDTKKAESYILAIKKYYNDGKINLKKELVTFNRNQFEFLKNAKFKNLKGSYNNDNTVFKITINKKDYFLKVMRGNKETLAKYKYYYSITTDCKMPAPKLHDCGVMKDSNKIYVVLDFFVGKEYNLFFDRNDFNAGIQCAKKVTKYFKNLENAKINKKYIPTVTIDDVYNADLEMLEHVYNSPVKKYMPCSKKTIVDLLDRFKPAFKNEKLKLIHGDIKLGNILFDGKKVCLVDNENFYKSFDIINFRYNIPFMFKEGSSEVKKGFFSQYMRYMNGGKIPDYIQDQVKFFVATDLIVRGHEIYLKRGGLSLIPTHTRLLKEDFYNKDIEWLK